MAKKAATRQPVTKASALDRLAWPPVLPREIASSAGDLLRQMKRIDGARSTKRAMRAPKIDKAHLSPIQIRTVTAAMVRNCAKREIIPPAELVDLVAYLLSGRSGADLDSAVADAMGWHRYSEAEVAAIEFERLNPSASLRQVAAAAKVDHKTIREWRQSIWYRAVIWFDDRRTWLSPSGES